MQLNYPCQMSNEEAEIYFSSDWYKAQIEKRKAEYVLKGVLTIYSHSPKPMNKTVIRLPNHTGVTLCH